MKKAKLKQVENQIKKDNEDIQHIHEECESNQYILLYLPKHPLANKAGYIQQHRYVMEKHLGRYLLPSEIVHHIDLDKTNNDISNLLLFNSQTDHIRFHNYGYDTLRISKLIEEQRIVETRSGAYITPPITGYKKVCPFCGETFYTRHKEKNCCSRICTTNLRLGHEMPTKDQLLEWLEAGYTKYRIMQLLDVTETSLDAFFIHHDIDYEKQYREKNYRKAKCVNAAIPYVDKTEAQDRLRNVVINVRNPKDLSIASSFKGMERFITWILENNYTTSPDTRDGRNSIRTRIYRALYKKRDSVYGLVIDSPNIISQLSYLPEERKRMPFATQEIYNNWVEQFYLWKYCKEIKILKDITIEET